MSNSIDILAKAKTRLIFDQPFFASIFLSMPLIEDNSQPTFATNGLEILYNSEYLSTLSIDEIVFILAHETMHCVFEHMHTRGDKNPNKWNIAGDYIINDLLTKDKIGSMPSGGLLDSKLVEAGQGTTIGVYNLLPKETEDKSAGQDGGALDSVKDAGQDQATISQNQSEMRVKVAQAKNAAKMCGKLSGNLERLVDEILKPRVDWKIVLRRFLNTKAKNDLSYSRPKRRFLAEDIYLPSLVGEKLGSIAVAIDCSGSVDQVLLDQFSSEIKSIFSELKPDKIEVIYFDSEILKTEVFTKNDEIKIEPLGGGGTAFSPIFDYLNKQDESPIACVVLTDLCCSDFGIEPKYPVLWATTYLEDAPFGEITKLGLE